MIALSAPMQQARMRRRMMRNVVQDMAFFAAGGRTDRSRPLTPLWLGTMRSLRAQINADKAHAKWLEGSICGAARSGAPDKFISEMFVMYRSAWDKAADHRTQFKAHLKEVRMIRQDMLPLP